LSFPKEIAEFMAKYKVATSDVWKIPQGSSGAYAIKHKALERVAAKEGITYDRPAVLQIDLKEKSAAVVVFAKLGDRTEWSTGEAAPYNCKNAYPVAMAEKRAKDRCILKLLQAHGDIYSDAELDGKRENPHTTKPEDVSDAEVNKDDTIPYVTGLTRRTKYKNPEIDSEFKVAQNEMNATKTPEELRVWGATKGRMLGTWPNNWEDMFRRKYAEHLAELEGKTA